MWSTTLVGRGTAALAFMVTYGLATHVPAGPPVPLRTPTPTAPVSIAGETPIQRDCLLPDLPSGSAARGERAFSEFGCIGCHTIKGVGGRIGPDLTEGWTRSSLRAQVRGLPAPADYITESLLCPRVYVVPGFENAQELMPPARQLGLTRRDIADIIAYLKSLAPP